MGCNNSKRIIGIDDIYTRYPEIEKFRKDFNKLRLNEFEVGRFYAIFKEMDKDGSGQISLKEMLFHLELDESPFTMRVFSIFDSDGSGEIDFKEFIISLWNYATMGKPSLVMFAFDLYDSDSSGEIDLPEVELMLREVYGNSFDTSPHAKVIYNQLASLAGGGLRKSLKRMTSKLNRKSSSSSSSSSVGSASITIDQFRDFVKSHPALLYPAFVLQTELQKKILGTEFWEFKATQRMAVSKGRPLTINQILAAHVNEAAFKDLVEGQVAYSEISPTVSTIQILQVTGLAHTRKSEGNLSARKGNDSARRQGSARRHNENDSARRRGDNENDSARRNIENDSARRRERKGDEEESDNDGETSERQQDNPSKSRKERLNEKVGQLRAQKRNGP